MRAAGGRSEITARRQRHMGLMQRAFAEGLRIEAGGADVEIRVERSVRHHFQRQSDAGESVHHECPAFQQFLPALLAYAQRLPV